MQEYQQQLKKCSGFINWIYKFQKFYLTLEGSKIIPSNKTGKLAIYKNFALWKDLGQLWKYFNFL